MGPAGVTSVVGQPGRGLGDRGAFKAAARWVICFSVSVVTVFGVIAASSLGRHLLGVDAERFVVVGQVADQARRPEAG